MAVSFALDNGVFGNPDATIKEGIYVGTLTFSGSYSTGGDTLSFANVQGVLAYSAPLYVTVYEQPTASPLQTATAYIFIYAKGSNASNGKLQIFSAQGTQLSAGAYGSAFSSTTVKCRVWFPLGQ